MEMQGALQQGTFEHMKHNIMIVTLEGNMITVFTSEYGTITKVMGKELATIEYE